MEIFFASLPQGEEVHIRFVTQVSTKIWSMEVISWVVLGGGQSTPRGSATVFVFFLYQRVGAPVERHNFRRHDLRISSIINKYPFDGDEGTLQKQKMKNNPPRNTQNVTYSCGLFFFIVSLIAFIPFAILKIYRHKPHEHHFVNSKKVFSTFPMPSCPDNCSDVPDNGKTKKNVRIPLTERKRDIIFELCPYL